MKEKLYLGMIIYDKQPRYFDYHPMMILEINKDSIRVVESESSGIGRELSIDINNLYIEDNSVIY